MPHPQKKKKKKKREDSSQYVVPSISGGFNATPIDLIFRVILVGVGLPHRVISGRGVERMNYLSDLDVLSTAQAHIRTMSRKNEVLIGP